MLDAAIRSRHHALVGHALAPTLHQAGFRQVGRKPLWVRNQDTVLQVVGLAADRANRDFSLEWAVWVPQLAKLFAEGPAPIDGLRRAHLRGGDRRLPSLRSEAELQVALPMASAALDHYLDVLRWIPTSRAAQDHLAHDMQRLWPDAESRPLYLAGLAVVNHTPDAADLADRAVARLGTDAAWRALAARVRDAASATIAA